MILCVFGVAGLAERPQPFTLGFPGGIRGSGASLAGGVDRDSVMSTSTSAQPPTARSTMFGVALPPPAPPLPTLPSGLSLAALIEAEETADSPTVKPKAENRASVDSFMDSARLASEWADSDSGSIH